MSFTNNNGTAVPSVNVPTATPSVPTPTPVQATATPATATSAPKPAGDKKAVSKAFIAQGTSAYQQLTDEQKSAMGSKASTLSFICSLGNPRMTTNRAVDGKKEACPAVCGATFVCSEDLDVYRISLAPNDTTGTGFTGEPRIDHIPAGTKMNLNPLEFAKLLSRPEFGGTATGGDLAIRLGHVCTTKDGKIVVKPVLNTLTKGTGSPKDNMVDIAVKGGDGKYTLKEEYKADFETYFKPVAKPLPKRKESINSTGALACAFESYLNDILPPVAQ